MSIRRRGFTLIEVMLAMAITILLLGAITMAIDFHLRVLDSGRREVEEAQLARAILRRIADDLRSTVRYEKIDVESMLSQASANSGAAGAAGAAAAALGGSTGGGGSSGGSGGGSGGSGGSAGSSQTLQPLQALQALQPQSGSSGGSSGSSGSGSSGSGSSGGGSSGSSSGSSGNSESSSEESTNQDLADSAVVNPEPGLYGNLYELQVDVSRLPRIDQYERMLATPDGRPTDAVSDVKTVAYYVLDGTTGAAGLVRREMDRAATSWAVNNGGLQELGMYEELLAPEVAGLEFRYFDGVEWLEEWDSTANKNLPVAVEISVAIAAPSSDRTAAAMMDLSSLSMESGYRVYRLLVPLPSAKTLAQQEAEAAAEAAKAAEEAAAGTTTTGTTTSSGSGSM